MRKPRSAYRATTAKKSDLNFNTDPGKYSKGRLKICPSVELYKKLKRFGQNTLKETN